jgi:hypothetical protein
MLLIGWERSHVSYPNDLRKQTTRSKSARSLGTMIRTTVGMVEIVAALSQEREASAPAA